MRYSKRSSVVTMRRKYDICKRCGANIDFGEKCDCQKEKKENKDRLGVNILPLC